MAVHSSEIRLRTRGDADVIDITRELAAALAAGPQPTVLTAEAVTPSPVVTQN